jgi:GGDEF domain-containing protein
MANDLTDDPRKLSALISRVSSLASDYAVPSVLVGLVADVGDTTFPEYIHYLQSALRVEDGIFRMTRERAVIHLADVDREQAERVMERLAEAFSDEFPALSRLNIRTQVYEAKTDTQELRVKDILTRLFVASTFH